MKPIAVVTPNEFSFHTFMKDLDSDEGDLEFVCIRNYNDLRGRWFGGYICLYNAKDIIYYDELIEQLKTRIK